ncbi:hypothetical protein BBta_6752 [Bradyrhizobium sp. BTAi1]|nr:hypothetical protein BBta_6752 [Bradyrhizobium sp. BTAi1]
MLALWQPLGPEGPLCALIPKWAKGAPLVDHQQFASLTRAELYALYAPLSLLRPLHKRMSLLQAVTFFHVMAQDDLTVTELAARVGVKPWTISRFLRDLGCVSREGRQSLGLVALTQRPHGDRREYRVTLTPAGLALARQMIALMKPALTPRAQPRSIRRRKGAGALQQD